MSWRRVIPNGLVATFLLLTGAILAQLALAQTPAPADSLSAELIGAPVLTGNGTQVGEVSAVTEGPDGQISEIRVTMASPLGLGQRTVVLPPDSAIVLRGAVVVDLSPAEMDALPSVSQLRKPSSQARLARAVHAVL